MAKSEKEKFKEQIQRIIKENADLLKKLAQEKKV